MEEVGEDVTLPGTIASPEAPVQRPSTPPSRSTSKSSKSSTSSMKVASPTRGYSATPSSPKAVTKLVAVSDEPRDSFDRLFDVPNLKYEDKEAILTSLRLQLEADKLEEEKYLDQLEEETGIDRVTLAALTYEDLAEQERQLQYDRLIDIRAAAQTSHLRKEDLIKLERQSRGKIAALAEQGRLILQRVTKQNKEQLRLYMRSVQQEFTINETRLLANVRSAGGHLITAPEEILSNPLKTRSGPVSFDGKKARIDRGIHGEEFNAVKQRKWRVEWEHTPQPLKIYMTVLRAVKDKVCPPLHYECLYCYAASARFVRDACFSL